MFNSKLKKSKSTSDIPSYHRGIKRKIDHNGETNIIKKRKIEKIDCDYINKMLDMCINTFWIIIIYIAVTKIYYPVIIDYFNTSNNNYTKYNYYNNYYNNVKKITN